MRSWREVWFPPNASLALAAVFFNKDFNFNLVNKGCNKLLSYIVTPSKMVIKVSCPVFLQDVSVVPESIIIVRHHCTISLATLLSAGYGSLMPLS